MDRIFTVLIFAIGIIVFGTIIYLVFGGGSFFVDDRNTQDDADENNNGTTTLISWQAFDDERFDFTFSYPENAEVSVEAERVKVTYLGPGNEAGTEITNGFTFYVRTQSVSRNTPLQNVAERQFVEETTRLEALSEPRSTVIGNRAAYIFDVESELGTPVTHVVMGANANTVYLVAYSTTGPDHSIHADIINSMLQTLRYSGGQSSVAPQFTEVTIALLETEFDGEPDRGCDRVLFATRAVATTTEPLTAALEELFALEETSVDGGYNFIANTNETLDFDRVTVEGGVASVYLTGELSGIAGVCDEPRAQIQIEETALQFSTVDSVVLYLNDEKTDLIPDSSGGE